MGIEGTAAPAAEFGCGDEVPCTGFEGAGIVVNTHSAPN